MSILSRYLIREFGRLFSLCVAGGVVLYLVIDLFDRIDRLIRYGATAKWIVLFLLYKLPLMVYQMIPAAMLLAVLLTLGILGRNNEVLALRTSGVPVWRIASPFVLISMLVSLFSFLLGEFLVPHSFRQSEYIWRFLIKKETPSAMVARTGIWFRGQDWIYQIATLQPAGNELKGVSLFEIARPFHLAKRIEAARAVWEEIAPASEKAGAGQVGMAGPGREDRESGQQGEMKPEGEQRGEAGRSEAPPAEAFRKQDDQPKPGQKGEAKPDAGQPRIGQTAKALPGIGQVREADPEARQAKNGKTGGEWVFYDGVERTFLEDGTMTEVRWERLPIPLPETPDDFREVNRETEEMPIYRLRPYIRKVAAEGYDPTPYRVELQKKLAYPVLNVITVLLGIPFALRFSRHGGIALGVGASVVLGFVYWVVFALTVAVGRSGLLPPFAAAWSANLLFGGLGVYLLLRVEEKAVY